jgi:hypothetical protein
MKRLISLLLLISVPLAAQADGKWLDFGNGMINLDKKSSIDEGVTKTNSYFEFITNATASVFTSALSGNIDNEEAFKSDLLNANVCLDGSWVSLKSLKESNFLIDSLSKETVYKPYITFDEFTLTLGAACSKAEADEELEENFRQIKSFLKSSDTYRLLN